MNEVPNHPRRYKRQQEVGDYMRGPKQRDLSALAPSVRSAQLWLGVDEVLGRIGLSRTTFWKLINEGSFPPPYYQRNRAIWPQSDVDTWIAARIAEEPLQIGVTFIPVTWASIESLMKAKSPAGLTNLQISHLLNADNADVSALTRLMAKAGVIVKLPPHAAHGSPLFYVHNEGVAEILLREKRADA